MIVPLTLYAGHTPAFTRLYPLARLMPAIFEASSTVTSLPAFSGTVTGSTRTLLLTELLDIVKIPLKYKRPAILRNVPQIHWPITLLLYHVGCYWILVNS